MGKVTMAGTGGGADLDVITAADNDVLAGKVIVGPDGEPLTGTLALTGTAADSQVLSGKTYYNTDAKTKRTGTMLTMGGQTITPGAAQQTVSCAGRYMTGNITVNAVSNLTAANIKKGVNVGGIIGIFEGYIPGVSDLYYRGNNIAGFTTDSYAVFDAGQITIKKGGSGGNRSLRAYVNFVGKKYINFEGNFSENYISVSLGGVKAQVVVSGSGTWSIPISSMQIAGEVWILFYLMSGVCYRIWLS